MRVPLLATRTLLICGAVSSRLTVTERVVVPPALVAVHAKLVPAAGVSAVIVVGSQPD